MVFTITLIFIKIKIQEITVFWQIGHSKSGLICLFKPCRRDLRTSPVPVTELL
jgi:hypothetical protein